MYICWLYMAVSILYPSITFIQITHQGNVFMAHAFHNTHPVPLWAGPPGPLRPGPCCAPEPLRVPLGPCGPGPGSPGPLWAGPLWPPWGRVGRALVGPPGPLRAGSLWALLGPYGLGPKGTS